MTCPDKHLSINEICINIFMRPKFDLAQKLHLSSYNVKIPEDVRCNV